MSTEKYREYTKEKCSCNMGTKWFNNIPYHFWELFDGWIAVFEYANGKYYPVVEARNVYIALDFCALREPVTVPLQAI